MILATRYEFRGKEFHQLVSYQHDDPEIEQRVQHLKKIAADSDMYNIGAEWKIYEADSRNYGKELDILPKETTPTNEQEIKYWQWQVDFLTNFKKRGFYTQSAGKVLYHLEPNLAKAQEMLAKRARRLYQAPRLILLGQLDHN